MAHVLFLLITVCFLLLKNSVSWNISLKVNRFSSGAVGGEPFSTQPIISVFDKRGTTKLADLIGWISVTLHESPSHQRLGVAIGGMCKELNFGETHSVKLDGGEAIFENLCINEAGDNYKLRYILKDEHDLILGHIVGGAFSVDVGEAFQINVVRNPESAYGGLPWRTQPIVAIQDKGFNIVNTIHGGKVRG